MADVFKKEDATSLLLGKHVLFIGDSNIRALYKDVLWLYKMNSLISLNFLKRRLENSFLGDRLLARSMLTRGRDFVEHRIFEDGGTTFEFLFVTRCYCDNIVKLVNGIKDGTKHCPDVILMNSCLWDVSRWGPSGVTEYKSNMDKLMKLLTSSLPKHVLFIWATALPIAALTSGGLIIKEIEFIQAVLRIHVIEANSFTAGLAASYGYDVLDFHHYMRYQIIRRSADGIHFLPAAMRFLTNLLLTHIALSWDKKLPGNLKTWTMPLASNIDNAREASANHEIKQMFRKIEIIADTLHKTVADTPNKKRKRRKNKKMSNIQVTHFVEEPNLNNIQHERESMKTPPYYHKAAPVNKITNCDIQNYNFASRNGNSNSYSSYYGMGQNYQITRLCNMGNYNNLERFEEDFCLAGFQDFDSGSGFNMPSDFQVKLAEAKPSYLRYASDQPSYVVYNDESVAGYSGYYPSELQYATNYPSSYRNDHIDPIYNYNDRISSYRSHPYKSSSYNGLGAWGDAYINQDRNPGPMRLRKKQHLYRR